MAAKTKIKIRRSSVSGKIPTTGDLDLGELAINTYDGRLFLKKSVSGIETIVGLTNNYEDLINIPQDLRTTASPSFSGITVNGIATVQETASGPQNTFKVAGSGSGAVFAVGVSDSAGDGIKTNILTSNLSSYAKYTINASEINLTIPGSPNISWKFDSSGKLTLPANGDIVDSNNVSVLHFPTVKRVTFDNPIVDLNSLIYTNATATDSATNKITLDSSTGFNVDDAVTFFGVAFGNLVTYGTFYVKSVPDSTSITISDTKGGSTYSLTTASGLMVCCTMSPMSYQTQRAPRLWTNYDSLSSTGFDYSALTFGDTYYDDASNKIYVYVNFGDGTPQPMDLTPVS